MAVERPHSSTSGTSSRSAIVEGENQVCWDIETYRLVTKRVEDLEAENRMLRSKVVVMAAENAALRERLDSEAHSRSLSQLLEQLRESNAQSVPSDASPSAGNQFRSEVPSSHHCLPCDYDHILRTQADTGGVQQHSSPQWKSLSPTQAAKPLAYLEGDEPKFWDIQSVISGSLVGDRIISQYHPKFPLLDDHQGSSYQPTMWSSSSAPVVGNRLNEHGTYMTMSFGASNPGGEAVAQSSQRGYTYYADCGGNGGMPPPPENELAENILRRRTRRRGRRGGKKHGGRRKKQETAAV